MAQQRYYTITPDPEEAYGRAIDLRRVNIGISGDGDIVTITLPVVYSLRVIQKGDVENFYRDEDITARVPANPVTLLADNRTKVRPNGVPYMPGEEVPEDAMGEFDFFYALIENDVPVQIRTMTIQKIDWADALGRFNR